MADIHNQEDLAALFSRNLSLQNNPYVEQTPAYVQAVENVDPPSYSASIQAPISYSVSQHYTHSAHVKAQPFKSASAPTSTTDQQTAEIILARHGVDVSTLFPAQLELFKSAELSQQMRLIQLWRMLPPSYGGHALAPNLCSWQTTNFEQEEAMAKMRYERQLAEEQQNQAQQQDQYAHVDHETGEDQSRIVPIQGGDGRWSGSDSRSTESYMTSGYEMLAQREYEASIQPQQPAKDVYSHFGTSVGGHAYNQATDPVYNIIPNSGLEWQQRQQQAMENQ